LALGLRFAFGDFGSGLIFRMLFIACSKDSGATDSVGFFMNINSFNPAHPDLAFPVLGPTQLPDGHRFLVQDRDGSGN